MKRLVLLSNQGVDVQISDLFGQLTSYSSNMRLTADDTLLFEGGTDVNPDLYNEKRNPYTSDPDIQRDLYEVEAFNRIQEAGGSCYGVCRGAQFLTVMNGGKLIQHVSGHAGQHHMLETYDGESIIATSTHHQMMAPMQTKHKLLAWPVSNQSQVYLGSSNKSVLNWLDSDMFLEPEIVWYPKTRSLAVQGHPEYLSEKHPFPQYCRQLLKKFVFEVTT